VGGATARQVSVEEQRRILIQKEQREREQQLSEQLIRQMQLEENPPELDEDDVTNDEVSYELYCVHKKCLWLLCFATNLSY